MDNYSQSCSNLFKWVEMSHPLISLFSKGPITKDTPKSFSIRYILHKNYRVLRSRSLIRMQHVLLFMAHALGRSEGCFACTPSSVVRVAPLRISPSAVRPPEASRSSGRPLAGRPFAAGRLSPSGRYSGLFFPTEINFLDKVNLSKINCS
jgi:hypothetical protein